MEVIAVRGLVRMVIVASMALVAVACGGGGDQGGGGDGGGATVQLAAQDISFDTDEITLTAGAQTTVEFDNKDELPHNLAIYEDESAETAIFQGDILEGPNSTEYSFTAPDAGTYFFRCDVHPTQMTGTVVVE
jgi:plastocyanin